MQAMLACSNVKNRICMQTARVVMAYLSHIWACSIGISFYFLSLSEDSYLSGGIRFCL